MASGSNIGIMDEAYFVGRKAILAWIENTFHLSVAKIEDTASGAIACQIADAVFPKEVPMSKIKWDARNDYEFVHNYKILQRVFQKKGVNKHVDVQKLIRGKYQDNLEFMQWMKRWYELNHGEAGGDYDPVARRSRSKSGRKVKPSTGSAHTAAAAPARGSRATENSAAAANRGRSGAAKPKPKPRARGGRAAGSAADPATKRKLAEANAQLAELKVSVDGLEKERDFYFGKLRDIEILLQGYSDKQDYPPSKDLVDRVFKILYATEEDFVVIDEEVGSAAAAPAPEAAAAPIDAGEDLRADLGDLDLGEEEPATATA